MKENIPLGLCVNVDTLEIQVIQPENRTYYLKDLVELGEKAANLLDHFKKE